MQLTQSGDQVSGTYEHRQGRVTGRVQGNQFAGTWSQAPSYQTNWDTGSFRFTLSSGCSSFSGDWRYADEAAFRVGGWNGTRTSGGQPPSPTPGQPPRPTAAPTARPCTWTGTWEHGGDGALMELTQRGNEVTGIYSHRWHDPQPGRITGRVQGNQLVGTYSEPSQMPGQVLEGRFWFTMREDCNSWIGEIENPWGEHGPWHAHRPAPITCTWSGTWETDFGTMQLIQSSDQVTGTYTHRQGRITGRVQGNQFTGTWSQAPSYQPDMEAGDVRFTLSADCITLTGDWRYGSGGDWRVGGWTGTRTR
jgi:hypothetical protein